MPSCWLFGNGKFCLMIDNTRRHLLWLQCQYHLENLWKNAISIGQNLVTILLDIDLFDKNFDKFTVGLHFYFFLNPKRLQNFKKSRPIIIYVINKKKKKFFYLLEENVQATSKWTLMYTSQSASSLFFHPNSISWLIISFQNI